MPLAASLLFAHTAKTIQSESPLKCRIDTADEADYFRHGGILHYVLRAIAKAA